MSYKTPENALKSNQIYSVRCILNCCSPSVCALTTGRETIGLSEMKSMVTVSQGRDVHLFMFSI